MTEQPTMECPKCGETLEDFDGFGVLAHDACGYCTCPAMDGIGDTGWFKCTICPRVQRHFKHTGPDYSGFHAASDWLFANGYRHAPALSRAPAGIRKQRGPKPVGVLPWHVLTDTERAALDGRITWGGGDPRTSDALVTLKRAPEHLLCFDLANLRAKCLDNPRRAAALVDELCERWGIRLGGGR